MPKHEDRLRRRLPRLVGLTLLLFGLWTDVPRAKVLRRSRRYAVDDGEALLRDPEKSAGVRQTGDGVASSGAEVPDRFNVALVDFLERRAHG